MGPGLFACREAPGIGGARDHRHCEPHRPRLPSPHSTRGEHDVTAIKTKFASLVLAAALLLPGALATLNQAAQIVA